MSDDKSPAWGGRDHSASFSGKICSRVARAILITTAPLSLSLLPGHLGHGFLDFFLERQAGHLDHVCLPTRETVGILINSAGPLITAAWPFWSRLPWRSLLLGHPVLLHEWVLVVAQQLRQLVHHPAAQDTGRAQYSDRTGTATAQYSYRTGTAAAQV